MKSVQKVIPTVLRPPVFYSSFYPKNYLNLNRGKPIVLEREKRRTTH